ncbi:SusD family protein [Bacteroidales bacterium Barb4]|nr:SusD family protein [Bacteroidales bacterium Barb4]
MKRIIIAFLAGIALITSMPSCTDLDENVYDKLPADQFGNTDVEVKALMGTTYNTLKTYWNEWFLQLSENGGSMAVTPTRRGGDWYDGGQYRELYMHAWTAQTQQIRGAWTAASTAIGTCNATISVLENSTLLTDAEKKVNVAAMRGVRAFWYYVMMDNWGNIPLVLSNQDRDLPAVKPRQEVFEWLVKEVTEIAADCPDASDANYGKFTKGAACTLLAKLYLNAEAWGVSVSGNACQLCIDACDKLFALGYYELAADWKDNFSYDNPRPKEAILTACYSDQDTDDYYRLRIMNRTLHYADNQSDGASYSAWNGIAAQPDYVKLFDPKDPRYAATFRTGQRYSLATGEVLMTGHAAPLNYTVDISFIEGTERDGTPWGDVVQEAGARCQKWPYASNLSDAMNNHFHIFRLADVKLMKAEALLRSGGSTAEATALVNEVRARAYGNTTNNYAAVTLETIALERKFELAWEAWSRQDDIRFGTFAVGAWTASNCPRKAEAYLKLYPISQDAWQTNPKLTQNPGYPAF